MGATACIEAPWFADRYDAGMVWRAMAWWIHDHLDYSKGYFLPKLAAFNLSWHEKRQRRIDSYIQPKGMLCDESEPRGVHGEWYEGFPPLPE